MIELGFEHTILLRGIFAFSAIHKASFLLPAQRQDLLQQADLHISQALEPFRRHIENPNDEEAVPMFVFSAILLTYNFGSVQEKPESPLQSAHHCLMLLNGIRVAIGPNWNRLIDSPALAGMFETSSLDAGKQLDMLSRGDERPEILRLVQLTELMLDAQDKTACTESIKELHTVAIRVRHVPMDQDEYPVLFVWAMVTTKHFFNLLASRNPVACIITTHFFALFAQARPVWWIEKWPGWVLAHTEQLLAATPDLLEWLLWPRNAILSAPSKTTPVPIPAWQSPLPATCGA